MLGAEDSDVGAFHVCLRSIPDGLNVTFLEEFDGAASFERPIARTKPLAYSLLGQRFLEDKDNFAEIAQPVIVARTDRGGNFPVPNRPYGRAGGLRDRRLRETVVAKPPDYIANFDRSIQAEYCGCRCSHLQLESGERLPLGLPL
jgi:hypothetical protein